MMLRNAAAALATMSISSHHSASSVAVGLSVRVRPVTSILWHICALGIALCHGIRTSKTRQLVPHLKAEEQLHWL